jgi:phosphatidylglycerophosphate synthase
MTDHSTDTHPWTERVKGAVWLALILFALAGLMVVGKLPLWIVGLVIAAGVALGALLFVLRWLVKRRDPAYSAGRSFGAFALGGALGMVGLASLPIFYLAFWVQSGPTAVPLATLSNGQKTVVFQGMQHIGSEDFYKSVVFDLEQALATPFSTRAWSR